MIRAHEAGWAHAVASASGPVWLPYPDDVNALLPQLWSQSAEKVDGVLYVGGVALTDLVKEHGSPAFVLDELDFRSDQGQPVRSNSVWLFQLYRVLQYPCGGHTFAIFKFG